MYSACSFSLNGRSDRRVTPPVASPARGGPGVGAGVRRRGGAVGSLTG